MEEFIILPRGDHSYSSYSSTVKFDEKQSLQTQSRQETNTEFVVNWTTNQTKVLLDIYKQYRSKVGSYEVKNLKKLWEIIANKINEVCKTNFTANHVENRWRVVARSYKKYVDSQNKTGSGRRHFEYREEMDEIFKGKKM